MVTNGCSFKNETISVFILTLFFVFSLINFIICIVWLCRASEVPDLQGPLTSLQSNLAGNARTLLMLLFLPTHCIIRTLLTASDFIYLHRKKASWVYYAQYSLNGFTWMWFSCAGSHCYLWHGVSLRLSTLPHNLSLSLLLFDQLPKCGYLCQGWGWSNSFTKAICGPKWQHQSSCS